MSVEYGPHWWSKTESKGLRLSGKVGWTFDDTGRGYITAAEFNQQLPKTSKPPQLGPPSWPSYESRVSK